MQNYIQITVKIKKLTYEPEFGRAFLSALIECDPSLTPEHFDYLVSRGNTTPYVDMENALLRWANCDEGRDHSAGRPQAVKWKRKQDPKYSCYIDHALITNFGDISPGRWNFTAKYNPKIDWLDLFRSICRVCDAQAGILHHFTSPEIRKPPTDFGIGIIAPAINPKFPEIAWGMMFGDDFVHAVDVEKLTAYGFPVTAVGAGYLVQVTDKLSDVSERFEYFAERREILRQLLPTSIFVDEDEERRKRNDFMEMFKEYKAKQGIAVAYDDK